MKEKKNLRSLSNHMLIKITEEKPPQLNKDILIEV